MYCRPVRAIRPQAYAWLLINSWQATAALPFREVQRMLCAVPVWWAFGIDLPGGPAGWPGERHKALSAPSNCCDDVLQPRGIVFDAGSCGWQDLCPGGAEPAGRGSDELPPLCGGGRCAVCGPAPAGSHPLLASHAGQAHRIC